MKLEEIKKYLGQSIILNLLNQFSYKGQITQINDDSFEFTDMYNTPMTLDARFVGMIIPHKDNSQQSRSNHVQGGEGQSNTQSGTAEGKHGQGTRKPSLTSPADKKSSPKKEFQMTEELAIRWKDEDVTENQRKVLKKMDFDDKDLDNMSKLEAYEIIKGCQKEEI